MRDKRLKVFERHEGVTITRLEKNRGQTLWSGPDFSLYRNSRIGLVGHRPCAENLQRLRTRRRRKPNDRYEIVDPAMVVIHAVAATAVPVELWRAEFIQQGRVG